MIVTAKKKKRYFVEDGNEITDPDLIADVKRGLTAVSYKEDMIEYKNQKRRKR